MYAFDALRYPPLPPTQTGLLDVGDGHRLHYDTAGNPDGIPVVYVHGGPGSWAKPSHRQIFNPAKYHIISYHQRGAGLSQPQGCLAHNTTAHLIADLEHLRKHLGLGPVLLFGGSWGATLSLLYAQAYPQQVLGLVLYGVFLGDQQWVDWLFEPGQAAVFFPEEYAAFQATLGAALGEITADAAGKTVTQHIHTAVQAGHTTMALMAGEWEYRLLRPGFRLESTEKPEAVADHFAADPAAAHAAQVASGEIELHYMAHNCFIQQGQILAQMPKIQHLPGFIAQGRYDLVCPPVQAWQVHQAWARSLLHIVPDAGHNQRELTPYLMQALECFQPGAGFVGLQNKLSA